MSWQRWSVVAGSFALLAMGCGPDDTGTGNGGDDPEQATIESFNVEPATVTSGEDVEGEQVQGTATISWETSNAGTVSLTKDVGDSEVALDDCEPAEEGAENCVSGGSLEVQPAEATTYTLTVAPGEGTDCGVDSAACAEAEVEVGVAAPATLSFDRDGQEFAPGSSFEVDYSVENAEEWTIGAWDGDELTACRMPEEDSDAPCVLEGESGEPAASGTLTVEARDSQITLSGRVGNGAGDNLGTLAPGDVTMDFTPAGTPMIDSFEADRSNVGVDGTVTLSWETTETTGVRLSTDSSTAVSTDLDGCASIDDGGAGSCDVQFNDEAAGSEVTFELVGVYSGDGVETETDPSTATVNVGQAATVDTFAADPTMLPEGGGDTTLSWATSNAESLTITDGDGNTVLDTANDEGVGQCQSEGAGCNLDADSIPVTVDANTTYTLTAENQFGSDASEVQVTVEDAPQITLAEVAGTDVTSDPAVLDSTSATLEWETMNADATTLERGGYASAGCDSQDVSWNEVSGFGGSTSGTYDVTGLDSARECFRLTAQGGADQTATVSFLVARQPSVTSFSISDTTVTTGDTITLSWETELAVDIGISVTKSAVSTDDLNACGGVPNGSCDVKIQPGTPQGDVEFTLTGLGGAETEDSSTATVTIGQSPTISTFTASPSTANQGDDVTLTWNTAEAGEVTIQDDAGNDVCQSPYTSPSNSEESCTISGIQSTTTWTLTASNDFGSETQKATTFVGASVDSFEVTGPNAGPVDLLQNAARLRTGDLDFSWTTTSADSVDLRRAPIPGSGNCSDAADADFSDVDTGLAANGSYTATDVVQNGCYRLVANASGTASDSSVTGRVTEIPFDSDIATDPASVMRKDPQVINVDMDVTGASALTLSARYVDGQGNSLEVRQVCDETSLDDGNVSHDDPPELDEVRCQHEHDAYNCTAIGNNPQPQQNSIPENAEEIQYELTMTDPEGDSATADSAETQYQTSVVVNDQPNYCN